MEVNDRDAQARHFAFVYECRRLKMSRLFCGRDAELISYPSVNLPSERKFICPSYTSSPRAAAVAVGGA